MIPSALRSPRTLYVDVVDNLLPELGGVEPVFHIISFSKHDIEIEGVEAQHSKDTVQENSCKIFLML